MVYLLTWRQQQNAGTEVQYFGTLQYCTVLYWPKCTVILYSRLILQADLKCHQSEIITFVPLTCSYCIKQAASPSFKLWIFEKQQMSCLLQTMDKHPFIRRSFAICRSSYSTFDVVYQTFISSTSSINQSPWYSTVTYPAWSASLNEFGNSWSSSPLSI